MSLTVSAEKKDLNTPQTAQSPTNTTITTTTFSKTNTKSTEILSSPNTQPMPIDKSNQKTEKKKNYEELTKSFEELKTINKGLEDKNTTLIMDMENLSIKMKSIQKNLDVVRTAREQAESEKALVNEENEKLKKDLEAVDQIKKQLQEYDQKVAQLQIKLDSTNTTQDLFNRVFDGSKEIEQQMQTLRSDFQGLITSTKEAILDDKTASEMNKIRELFNKTLEKKSISEKLAASQNEQQKLVIGQITSRNELADKNNSILLQFHEIAAAKNLLEISLKIPADIRFFAEETQALFKELTILQTSDFTTVTQESYELLRVRATKLMEKKNELQADLKNTMVHLDKASDNPEKDLTTKAIPDLNVYSLAIEKELNASINSIEMKIQKDCEALRNPTAERWNAALNEQILINHILFLIEKDLTLMRPLEALEEKVVKKRQEMITKLSTAESNTEKQGFDGSLYLKDLKSFDPSFKGLITTKCERALDVEKAIAELKKAQESFKFESISTKEYAINPHTQEKTVKSSIEAVYKQVVQGYTLLDSKIASRWKEITTKLPNTGTQLDNYFDAFHNEGAQSSYLGKGSKRVVHTWVNFYYNLASLTNPEAIRKMEHPLLVPVKANAVTPVPSNS